MSQENLMSRRTLLFAAAGTAALAAKPGAGLHVASQTNAFPIHDKASFFEALATLKRLGFEGFETSFRNLQGDFAHPEALRSRLEETGLRFFGIHIFLTQYDAQTQIAPWDQIKQVVDGGAALGAERLILSGGSTPDAAALSRKAGALSRAGNYCRGKGIGLAYHNHFAEFENGAAQIEGLLKETDPALFHLIVDAGHVFRAKGNVAEFFTKHSRRIDGLHLRDAKAGAEVPLGAGDYDWKPLAAAIQATNWKGWLLTEEERLGGDKPGEAAIKPAREAIRRIFGA